MAHPKVDKEPYKDYDNHKNMRRERITKNNQLRKEHRKDKIKNSYKHKKLEKIYSKWDDDPWD